MPGSVISMTPTAVFPETLSRAFTETQTYAANVAEYHDGSSQQLALVSAPRHAWRLSKHLPPADLVTLRDFILIHIADSFWFYSPKETVPPNTSDPTGVDPIGRYAVRINSDWSQSMGIALCDTTVELIEVTSLEEAEMVNHLTDLWITLQPPRGMLIGGADLAPPLKVLLPSDAYALRVCAAVATSKQGSVGKMDMQYETPAHVLHNVFPGGVGSTGADIDGEVVTDFVSDPVDIPNGSKIYLSIQTAFTPGVDDELTLQVRGEVVLV
jgi:hypothetical protein